MGRCRVHGGGRRCARCGETVRNGCGATVCHRHAPPRWSPAEAAAQPYDGAPIGVLARERMTNAALQAWAAATTGRYSYRVLPRAGKRISGTRLMPDWSALVTSGDGASSPPPLCHVVVETDETAHCSERSDAHWRRMRELAERIDAERATRWGVLFVRFNPDECNAWKETQSHRLGVLTEWLQATLDVWVTTSPPSPTRWRVAYAFYPWHSKHRDAAAPSHDAAPPSPPGISRCLVPAALEQ